MKPTDETVERVARAILQGHDWTHDGGDDPALPTGWESVRPDWQDAYRAMARAAIAAMPEPWMTIDDNTPADQDLQLGWWEKWPERAWMQRIGYARSTRGGWNDGRPTHWRHLPSPPQKDEQPSPAALLKP